MQTKQAKKMVELLTAALLDDDLQDDYFCKTIVDFFKPSLHFLQLLTLLLGHILRPVNQVLFTPSSILLILSIIAFLLLMKFSYS